MFIDEDENGTKFFNHQKLHKIIKKITRNLDTVIDRNYYPAKEAKNSNFRKQRSV
jgi:ribonucleoside-diphosphate reductase alpha chain